MSYISNDADISSPRFGHVWRAEDGAVYATVRLAESTTSLLSFDSADDARAVMAACAEAASAMDSLAAEGASRA